MVGYGRQDEASKYLSNKKHARSLSVMMEHWSDGSTNENEDLVSVGRLGVMSSKLHLTSANQPHPFGTGNLLHFISFVIFYIV